MLKRVLMLICLCLLSLPAWAQETADPVAAPVEVIAGDGLALRGNLYRPETQPDGGAPALLLLHQYQSSRAGYKTVIPQFVEAGYIVLVVDLRGHGATGGERDWVKAQDDTQAWLTWLQAQEGVNPNKLAVIGASIGANLAIIGCAQFENCVTVVALSPGLDYFGVKPEEYLVNHLAGRSALLIAGRLDWASAEAIRTLFAEARGKVAAEMFLKRTHGTAYFAARRDREMTMALILTWLEQEFLSVKP